VFCLLPFHTPTVGLAMSNKTYREPPSTMSASTYAQSTK
jgi:hypothetical protein